MVTLRDFFLNNPWALAIASLGSLVSFAVLVLPPLWRFAKYATTAIFKSVAEANRRSDIRSAFMAVRCLEEPSFYIAHITSSFLFTLVPVAFLMQTIVDVIANQRAPNWTPASLSTLDKLTLFFGIGAICLGIIRLLFYYFRLSVKVMAISERRRRTRKTHVKRGARLKRRKRPSLV